MPIYKGTLKTGAAYKGSTSLSRIYKGAYLVFEAFQTLIAEGMPPFTLLNCMMDNLLGYKVYGNSSQTGTPTPTVPIEVECVGDKTRNLWNPDGTDYGWILTDGTRSTSQGVGRRITVEYGKTYSYVSYRQAGGFYNCVALYDENMNYINGSRTNIQSGATKTNTKTITDATAKYMVCAYYTVGNYSAPDWGMIIEGTIPDAYEPYYTGFRIPITVSGINLFNKDAAEPSGCTLSGEKFTSTSSTSNIDIELPAGTYTLTCDNTTTLYIRNGKVSSGSITSKTSSEASKTFNYTASVDGYLRLSFFSGSVSYIKLEKGSGAHDFEPYYAPRTYDIYLNRPLCKIGNYTDYIDFEAGKIVRNTAYIEYTGTEAFSNNTSLQVEGYQTCLLRYTYVTGSPRTALSNSFFEGSYNTKDNIMFWGGNNNEYIYFRLDTALGGTTAATFKAWFAAQYNDGNPVTLVFPRSTAEGSVTLPDILLNKGTNIITVGTSKQPSNMWIKYKGKA